MTIHSLPDAVAIGASLHEARLAARWDLADVEHATKIRARYLAALEHEEWDELPGPVYVKSFLRTYADALGLDSQALVDEYKRRHGPPILSEPVRPRRERRPPPARAAHLPRWLALAGVAVAIVAALYVLGIRHQLRAVTTPARPAVARRARRVARARPRVTTVTVALVPTNDVYVCMVDGSGRKLIPGQVFHAGDRVPVERAGKLLLTLGNNAVQVTVNGRPLSVGASSQAIGLELTPQGSRPLPPAQQPQCT